MSVTREVSQPEMSALKLRKWAKRELMSVTPKTHQSAMAPYNLKAASAFDMAKFGKSLGISGGLRFADAKQMEASLGVAQDFVSPLTLVKDADCVVEVVIDAALQEGDAPLFLLPPGINTESWPLTCTELLAFCSAGGRSAKAVDFGAL